MIISVNGREKKIAILDNGRVSEFYIERGEDNAGIAGNIYKGRVQRVLPGMQSAFVAIGLERDAFLYVSDFFDEEEEIERIVMEKSKKSSPEEAKREANERIERSRVEREKQMESAQEITEPLTESDDEDDEKSDAVADRSDASEKRGRSRGRRGRPADRDERQKDERKADDDRDDADEQDSRSMMPEPVFDFDDSGFERVIDDEDTGELFKDAYLQEAIFDKVRAVEFDMESIDEAPVGSLLGDMSTDSRFERIADEDEEQPAKEEKKKPARSRAAKSTGKTASKRSKAKGDDESGETADTKEADEKPKKTSRAKSPKEKTTKAKTTSRKKKADDAEGLPDGEARVQEPGDTAEMSVRRGGRGRRRGGRGRKPEGGEGGSDAPVGFEDVAVDSASDGTAAARAEEKDPTDAAEKGEKVEKADKPPKGEKVEKAEPEQKDDGDKQAKDDQKGDQRGGRGRGERSERGGRGGKGAPQGRGGRNDSRSDNREGRDGRDDRKGAPTISDLLREGQEILVQIAKEPIAKKGARITSHIALPGRFLVYMPTIEHLGVSRKIESSNERARLRAFIQRIRQEEEIPSGGFIVRTAGVGISEEDLRQDARYLVRTWVDIRKQSEKAKSPALVHQDLDLVQRLLRDQLSDEFTAIRVDSEEEYLRTVEFINRIQPRMVKRIKLYTREAPILEAYGVQEEIDKALKPRVWLKSGGYLVINQTEALVAIDVNTGKFVGKGNARLEDTITRTNMEAVDEIARQIRLRDLGGIIVLDLIDMEDRRNRHKVSQALQEALASDKSPNKVLSFNDFGLIIMTRKRVKQSLERTMCSPCEYCEGAGWIKSATTICYEILAEARRLSKELDDVRQTTLRIHPEVSKALRTSERAVLDEIEAYLGNVDITSDASIHQAQFDFAFV